MSTTTPTNQPPVPQVDTTARQLTPDAAAKARLDRRRHFKDKMANGLIAGGGIFVLLAILAIFVYLLTETWPLFKPSSVTQTHTAQNSTTNKRIAFTQMDEHNQTAMRLLPTGQIQVFAVATGKVESTIELPIPAGDQIVHVKRGGIVENLVGVGLASGQLIVFKPEFSASGVGADRVVTASVAYPFGSAPLLINDMHMPLSLFAIQAEGDKLDVIAPVAGQLQLEKFSKPSSGSGEGGMLAEDTSSTPAEGATPAVITRNQVINLPTTITDLQDVHFGQAARWMYLVSHTGKIVVLSQTDGVATVVSETQAADVGAVSTSNMLQGDISLLIGDTHGVVSQWFMVRKDAVAATTSTAGVTTDASAESQKLTKIRQFTLGTTPISVIAPEPLRKGFLAGDESGKVGYFYTTSEREIAIKQAASSPITALTLSFHGEGMLVDSQAGSSYWTVDAHHPDVSLTSLWGKVWYESYQQPTYSWQSTSGNTDFEAKMSLVPLTFGTLKAAFWAMIFAAPLAVAGAMYTAAFMSQGLRTKVKPIIELMQALPTVILGFLAGLWLAPLVTDYLPAVFSVFVIVPVIILLCGFLWQRIPLATRNRVPDGYLPVILILPIVISVWVAFSVSQPLELAVFHDYGGSLVGWLKAHGIDYQSQNALIVGLIMGFAVIAPIYSISEDALFAVPKHLVNGSLALGATPWQTMITVTLLTASPGIFSALMIGFGRAVGETMIVLMATGNTAIMDMSLFDGMRTLSANVAVEMGEAEVGSTHFRVLFLSALVLFVLTFVLNTIAELVRNRLRKKYSSL